MTVLPGTTVVTAGERAKVRTRQFVGHSGTGPSEPRFTGGFRLQTVASASLVREATGLCVEPDGAGAQPLDTVPMAIRRPSGYGPTVAEDASLDQLLRRPDVIAAVEELGVTSLSVEHVLTALRRFGAVRIDVGDDRARPYTCVLAIPGEQPESTQGTSVLHSALACWAVALEGSRRYTDLGLEQVARFLARADDAV